MLDSFGKKKYRGWRCRFRKNRYRKSIKLTRSLMWILIKIDETPKQNHEFPWIKYKSSARRECHDENVFLKADRASSKLNFLFHLKSKTNLVALRKCNSHLQYYKIDLSFSINLQEINWNECEECKTKREARQSNRARWARSNLRVKRATREENVCAKRADFFN